MDDSQLLSILATQRNNSIGIEDTDLADDQEQLLDYYYGRTFGNEKEDQSQFVTRDVQEVVDRMMSAVIRVFANGSSVVAFDPTNGDDIEQAEQESEVVNYILTKDNEWFPFVWAWAKTAFLEKNSYAKVWVEDVETITTETYTGLSDEAFAQVLNADEVEPIEHTSYTESMVIQTPMGEVDQEVSMHDIKINITETDRKIKDAALPSEEVSIAQDWNKLSLKDCPYVAHKTTKMVSDLIEQGFDAATLSDIPAYDNSNFNNSVKVARNQFENEETRDEADESTREITVYEEYILIDMDGNDRAELRKITSAGDKILENEQVDFIPIATLCPNPMPHQHAGLSIADPVKSIQYQKSTLVRQIFDNLHLTNNPEKIVIEDEVCMDDLLESMAGGIKRATRTDAIVPIITPFTAGASFPMLEQLENMKQSWSGVSSQTTNLNPNVLSQSTEGAFMAARESVNELTETIVRTFAETGFKELALMTHELFIKNQDKEKMVKVRDEYVSVDPKEWKARTSMTVKVGLGTGDKDKSLQRLFGIIREQKELMAMGAPLVEMKNLYNTYDRIVEVSDLKETSLYFTDPSTPEAQQAAQAKAQQKQPNPLAEAEQVKGQLAIEKEKISLQAKAQIEQIRESNKSNLKQMEESNKANTAQNKLYFDMQMQNQKDEFSRQLIFLTEQFKLAGQHDQIMSNETIKAAELEKDYAVEGMKVDLGKAGIGAGLQDEQS